MIRLNLPAGRAGLENGSKFVMLVKPCAAMRAAKAPEPEP